MGIRVDNKTAAVKYYHLDPDVIDFHYAWIILGGHVLVSEFNSSNWPMHEIRSYASVREYLLSLNPEADMMMYDDVIASLYNLMNDDDLEVEELKWIRERMK